MTDTTTATTARQEVARAKVNLYLRVTGRRADGYHLLDSLAVFAEAKDILTAGHAEALTLDVTGREGTGLGDGEDNLVLRAARALAQSTGREPKAAITLTKLLPVASGIGGGSADAAAALRLLNALWDTRLTPAQLAPIAATLGADVPVCIASEPARMQGIGEILTPAPALPACGLLMANPRIALPTPQVFRARHGAFSTPAKMPDGLPHAAALAEWLRPLGNDLQDAALTLCAAIAEVLSAIAAQPGCLLARMSGSGATCFGIFTTPAAASAAAKALPAAWWRHGGGLAAV